MKKQNQLPPKIARWLLKRFLSYYNQSPALGDLEEEFSLIKEENGVFRARRWYRIQVLKSLPRFCNNLIFWSSAMFKNYLKIAFRNMFRQKMYSFINITGLAIGIVCCILIALWVIDEMSFDKFHKDYRNIYQVLIHGTNPNNPSTPAPLAPALKEEIPEIIDAVRTEGLLGALVSYKSKTFYENNIVGGDPSFFQIFTFSFIKGDPDAALENLHSIVISEAIAERYFADENPIGKILSLGREQDFTVTGVIRNVPDNSTLQFDMAVPFEIRIQEIRESGWEMNWGYYSSRTFLKLRDNCKAEEINNKIGGFLQKHVEGEDAVLTVLPFTQRYLFFIGSIRNIYIFSAIGLFILLIACINFMNISTARSANRAKEIGLRKVAGAYRRNIIIQFLGESFLLSFVALILSLILFILLLPLFNTLTGKTLSYESINEILPLLLGIVFFTAFAAGSYPALFLSSFRPVKILKGNLKSGLKSSGFRKTLVVIQFSVSLLLIIGTGVIYKQLIYIKNRDIGYDKEHIIRITLRGESRESYTVMKTELLRDERITGISGTALGLPYFRMSSGTADWDGKDPNKEILICANFIDYDFIETMNIEMVEGRDFSRELPTDTESYLVNEEMAEIIGLESAVGARLTYWNNTGKIIGVMKNFNFRPLNNQIEPLVLILGQDRVSSMLIRIQSHNIASTLEFIQEKWKNIIPNYPFQYNFLDDVFDRSYRIIERTGNLLNSFAILAVFIACLGLFGLASFTAEQRSKEIGIRKVLGSSVSRIVLLLLKEFTGCILVAIIIAWPAAYFIMNQWLKNFAFRTKIGIGVFILSAVFGLLIALFSVSYQSIKAALSKPVDSLRYE